MSGLEEIAEKYKSTIIYLTQPSPTPLNFVFQETGLLCRLVCPRLQHCRHQHVQESRLHHLPNSPWILFRFTRWRRLRYKISILKTQINSTNRLILCRHEKGVISRCKQRVSHPVNSSCTAWRYRLINSIKWENKSIQRCTKRRKLYWGWLFFLFILFFPIQLP